MIQNDLQKKVLIALKKARSGLDRTIAQIEDGSGKDCFAVMQQNLAVIGLLKSANALMLERHIDTVLADDLLKKVDEEVKDKLQAELVRIVRLAQKK